MSFKYTGLIKSLEICLRNEWGQTDTSRSIMRSLIWEATQALIDCKREFEDAELRKLSPAGSSTVPKHGFDRSVGFSYGSYYGSGSLNAPKLEDEDDTEDHGLGSLLKRTGI